MYNFVASFTSSIRNMENKSCLVAFGVLLEILFAAAGVAAFHYHSEKLFLICAVLCGLKFFLMLFVEGIKDIAFPYMAVCMAFGYYMTGTWLDTLCYGICLYYATAFLYMGLLHINELAVSLLFIFAASVVSIVGWLTQNYWLFMIASAYCVVWIIMAWVHGRLHAISFRLLALCVIAGLLLYGYKDVSSSRAMFYVNGVLLGCAFFDPLTTLLSLYYVYVKKMKSPPENFNK